MRLELSTDGTAVTPHLLGPRLETGAAVQVVVPAGCWQAAASLGAWTLVSCVVVPAFHFAGFHLAPPGWRPGGP